MMEVVILDEDTRTCRHCRVEIFEWPEGVWRDTEGVSKWCVNDNMQPHQPEDEPAGG